MNGKVGFGCSILDAVLPGLGFGRLVVCGVAIRIIKVEGISSDR